MYSKLGMTCPYTSNFILLIRNQKFLPNARAIVYKEGASIGIARAHSHSHSKATLLERRAIRNFSCYNIRFYELQFKISDNTLTEKRSATHG